MERRTTLGLGARGVPGRTLTLLLLVALLSSLMCGSAFASTIRAVAASGLPGATVQVPILFDLLSTGETGINKIQILANVTADTGAVPITANLDLYNSPYGSLTPQAAPNNLAPAFNLTPSTTTFDWNWQLTNSLFGPISGPQTGVEACRMLVTLPATAIAGTTYTVHLVSYNTTAKTGSTVKVAGGGPKPSSGSTIGTDVQITVAAHTLDVTAGATLTTVASAGSTDLTASAVDSWDDGIFWAWDDGGAGGSFSPSASVQNPTYTAPFNHSGGDVAITLTATATCDSVNSISNTDTVSLTVTSTPLPEVDFSGTPTTGRIPLEVTFTDASTNTPTAWSWDFGDGTSSTEQNPTHSYANGGSYTVALTSSTAGGSATASKAGYISAATFLDVDASVWGWAEIETCVAHGIVQGYGDGRYGPLDVVSRGQMAIFVARALAGGDSQVPTTAVTADFSDVPADHWAFRYVEYASSQHIVNGYGDGRYGPDDHVNRGQMSAFITRSIVSPTGDAGLADYVPPTTPSFTDVTTTTWGFNYIEYLHGHGIVNGYTDGTYHPEYEVTRDQMAVFVSRAFKLTP